ILPASTIANSVSVAFRILGSVCRQARPKRASPVAASSCGVIGGSASSRMYARLRHRHGWEAFNFAAHFQTKRSFSARLYASLTEVAFFERPWRDAIAYFLVRRT